jgi:hypothetical protein
MRAALPELETSPMRLPTPLIATSVVDPDATNALPVMRASDRPPPIASTYTPHDPRDGHHSSGSISSMPPSMSQPSMAQAGVSGSIPPGSIPPYPGSGATGPSWHTPNTSYASITVSAPKPRGNTWLLIAAGTLVIAALGAGVGLGWKSRGGNATASSPARATETSKPTAAAPPSAVALPTPPGATTAAPAPTGNEPPSISVDSLPGMTSKPLGPVPHGSGRLLVTAAPGWCNLTVDGKERGPTPVAGLDLTTGAHHLRCDAPGGKVKTASVTVQEGATSRVKLALDD